MEKEEAKSYIIEALIKLLEKKNYNSIRIDQIVNTAGVSRSTFYRCFHTKDEIINGYLKQKEQEFLHRIGTENHNIKDAVYTAFLTFKENKIFFELLEKNHLSFLYLEYMNAAMATSFTSTFAVDPFQSYFYSGALYNISIYWLKNGFLQSVNDMTELFYNMITHGNKN